MSMILATVRLTFNVFETDRDCIIGLESLLLHYMEVFQNKLSQVKSQLSLFLSTHVYPKEPGGRQVDIESLRTGLHQGQEILVGKGIVAQAPEELGADSEYKQRFTIPKTSIDSYNAEAAKILDKRLYNNK